MELQLLEDILEGGGEIQLRKKGRKKSLCFLVLQQTNVQKDQDGLLCSLDLGLVSKSGMVN